MSPADHPQHSSPGSPSDPDVPSTASVPFEAIPELAANEDYIAKMDRLRELKRLEFRLFNSDERKGRLGEYEALKRECAAMGLVHGASSVTYLDLRVARVPGGMVSGKIPGTALRPQILMLDLDKVDLFAVIAAAEDFDPAKLLEAGLPASAIAAARKPGKPRADSIRVEWVGNKGTGAQTGRRGTGAGAGSGQPQ